MVAGDGILCLERVWYCCQLGAGLTGTPYDSGGRKRDQGISEARNRRVRTMTIDIAWLWLRYQPHSSSAAGGGRSDHRSQLPGVPEVFRIPAPTSGSLAEVSVYVDPSSTASKLIAGIYTDNTGHPGTLLAQGTLNAPDGSMNDVPLPRAVLTTVTPILSPCLALAVSEGSASGGLQQRRRDERPNHAHHLTRDVDYRDNGPMSVYDAGYP